MEDKTAKEDTIDKQQLEKEEKDNFIVGIFKMLLQLNNLKYGLKKKF